MTTIKPLREEALRAGFAALLDRLPHGYSFEYFKQQLADWEIRAFHDGKRTIGMLMTRGDEIHVAVLPEVRGRWLSRRLIRETFAPILAKYGRATTSVTADNAVGRDFVQRIRAGFADLTFDPMSALQIGGSVVSGLISADAAQSAGQTQANAANNATQAQLQMFNTQNQQQAPYRQAGYNALNAISAGFGFPSATGGAASAGAMPTPQQFITAASPAVTSKEVDPTRTLYRYEADGSPVYLNPDGTLSGNAPSGGAAGGFNEAAYKSALNAWTNASQQSGATPASAIPGGYFAHQFNAGDLNANLAPNWKFALDQGIGATKNAANLQTGLLSGNALKGIADYTLNKSGDLYQQAYNNFTANQSNIFNRLSTVAGLGSAANQQSSGLAGSLAPSLANTITGAGAAQAAGTVGAANAITGGANNALGWYTLNQFMNPGGVTIGNPGGETQIGDWGAS